MKRYQIWIWYWNNDNEDIVRPLTGAHDAPWDAVRELSNGAVPASHLVEVKTRLVKTPNPSKDWRYPDDLEFKRCIYRLVNHPDVAVGQEWVGVPPLYAEDAPTQAEIIRFE